MESVQEKKRRNEDNEYEKKTGGQLKNLRQPRNKWKRKKSGKKRKVAEEWRDCKGKELGMEITNTKQHGGHL